MKHPLRLLFVVFCYTVLLKAQAQPAGSLDPTFGKGGIGRYSVGLQYDYEADVAKKVLLQPDGKIIIAGNSKNTLANSVGVMRVNIDGSLDSHFGQNGIVCFKNGRNSELTAAALQPDGKLLLAGSGGSNGINSNFSVVRLDSNGSLDNNFDGDGKLLMQVGLSSDFAQSIALQPNGKILLAGYSSNGHDNDFSVVRLNSNGSLDSGFNGNGKLLIPVGDSDDRAQSIALQSDGKIILAGYSSKDSHTDFAVVRLNNDGSLDSSFQKSGRLILPKGSSQVLLNPMILQPDGKIILGGYDSGSFVMVRLKSNGSLDSSFDDDGQVQIEGNIGVNIYQAIALQPDGKILVAGYKPKGNDDFSVMRLNSNGHLDKSFGNKGYTKIDIYFSYDDEAYSIALQSDGKILLAGTSIGDFVAVRLTSNGSLDSSFDYDGKFGKGIHGSFDYAEAIALQPDGKILMAGYSDNSSNKNYTAVISVARLSKMGDLDTSFDGDGKLLIPVVSIYDRIKSLAVQPDGKILLAGYGLGNSNYDFLLMRLNIDGSMDKSFQVNGKLLFSTSNYNDWGQSIALQPDGKILLSGYSDTGSNHIVSVVRLNSDGSPDNSFGNNGRLLTGLISDGDKGYCIVLQPDGKILLTGSGNFVIRLNSNGSPDNTFADHGHTVVPMGANSIALQPDGKILIGGFHDYSDFSISRLNSNGGLDSNFDEDGIMLIPGHIGYYDNESIALQPDGKILLAGMTLNNGSYDFLAVRLNNNGTLDESFDNDGKAFSNTLFYEEYARTSVLQPDGNFIVAGYGDGEEPGREFIAMRFLSCDNGNCSPVKITIDNAAVEEGNTSSKKINFFVSLSDSSSQTVTVNYTTQNGTAKSLNDYVANTGTLTFPPGMIKKKISVTIHGDTDMEPDETFKVNLTNAVNATIVDAKGIGTIINDDVTTLASTNASDALEASSNKQSISISPNPVDAVLKVDLLGYTEEVTLQLQNLHGKILKQQNVWPGGIKRTQCRLNVADLASGIYLLSVFDKHGKRQTEKVMVRR